jgi:hypothetical protein
MATNEGNLPSGEGASDSDVPRTFEDMMADDGLDEKSLQVELEKYRQAYKQEFELKAQLANNPAEIEATMREFFQNNVTMASAQIAHLAAYSTSDAVRLNASKYIVEAAFRAAELQNDPLSKLFDELKANDPAPAAEAESK